MKSHSIKTFSKLKLVWIYSTVLFFQLFFFGDLSASCVFAGYIEAEEVEVGNMLTWVTVRETNNEKFLIQKSKDGFKFENFGYLRGAGNSTERNRYSFLDSEIGTKTSYYRLIQVDFDGKEYVTHTVKVDRKMSNNFVVSGMSSTITDKDFSVIARSETEGLILVKINGPGGEFTMHWQVVKGTNSLIVDLENASTGSYNVNLDMDGEIEKILVKKVLPGKAPKVNYQIEN